MCIAPVNKKKKTSNMLEKYVILVKGIINLPYVYLRIQVESWSSPHQFPFFKAKQVNMRILWLYDSQWLTSECFKHVLNIEM